MRKVARAGLRHGVKKRIPAAHIGAQRMLHPDAVAQVDAMLFARPPAIREILPLRHEGREHAVLHMKHRHVLMQRDFKPLRRRGGEQVDDLFDVQIVADRHALQPVIFEKLGGQRVRDIQGKVADFPQSGEFLEMLDRAEIADQHAVRRGVFDEPEEPDLAGFLNAWGGEEDGGSAPLADEFHRIGVAADVLEIDIHFGDACGEGRAELVHRAAEDTERRVFA